MAFQQARGGVFREVLMVIYFAAAAAGAQTALVRVCPKCRRKQVVALKHKKSAVKCRRCGAMIPAKTGK